MSSATSINDVLSGYLAGKVTAERVVAAVAAEYYRESGNGKRETWRPIVDVIERAHPGIVELTGSQEKPGFAVRLAERPFPQRYEAELRQATERVLMNTFPVSRVPNPEKPGLLKRIVAAIRRVFNA